MEELRRRVQADPASIAFAALAEEYRRAGRHNEAIETCRIGLQRHPSYLSARVTLGRSLIEIGEYEAARQELALVLRSAPENLAAIRAMAEIHERAGAADGHDEPVPLATAATAQGRPPASAAAVLDWATPAPAPAPAVPRPSSPPHPQAAVIARLERYLAAIQAARTSPTTTA